MPTNLDALPRYHTIDRCLQSRFRAWMWEDLSAACFEALDEIRYRNIRLASASTPSETIPASCAATSSGSRVETKLQVAEYDDAQRVIAHYLSITIITI
jgi:hypothetical protein